MLNLVFFIINFFLLFMCFFEILSDEIDGDRFDLYMNVFFNDLIFFLIMILMLVLFVLWGDVI